MKLQMNEMRRNYDAMKDKCLYQKMSNEMKAST